jgi:5-methylcytosine-specific restriction enzyme A
MFIPGQIIRRRDLHSIYGGQGQGGISTPTNHPFIMLFTGESGLSHGYQDGWTETGIFLYSGEGQLGDMSFVRGNRALRDHLKDGKDVHLFEYVESGLVRYVGQMIVTGYHERPGTDGTGNQRHTIVFELVPAEAIGTPVGEGDEVAEASLTNASNEELRRIAESSIMAEATPHDRQRSSRRQGQALREYVLRRANGTCEGCGNSAPFVTAKGIPFLELHYLRRGSDVGPESPAWVAALCPNCHKRVHRSVDAAEYNRQILERLSIRKLD